MRLISTLLVTLLLALSLSANAALTEDQLQQELKQAEANKEMANQAQIVESLQNAINWLSEARASQASSAQYQAVIDDFPRLMQTLRHELKSQSEKPLPIDDDLT